MDEKKPLAKLEIQFKTSIFIQKMSRNVTDK